MRIVVAPDSFKECLSAQQVASAIARGWRNAAPEDREEIALVVSFIMARMGDNLAESWCERQIHVSNQIMTCDRTSMGPDLLEWLAVLRMNSAWMLKRMNIFAGLLKCVDLRATEGLVVLD